MGDALRCFPASAVQAGGLEGSETDAEQASPFKASRVFLFTQVP